MDNKEIQGSVLQEIIDLMDQRLSKREPKSVAIEVSKTVPIKKDEPTDKMPEEGEPGHEEMEPESEKESEVKELLSHLSPEELDILKRHISEM